MSRLSRVKRPLVALSIDAAVAALSISLLGFNLFTGTSIIEVLVAVNGFCGSALARITPLLAKTLMLLNVLADVAGDLVRLGFSGLVTASRVLGPQGLALVLGLGVLLTGLAIYGAKRFLHQGE